MTIETSFRAALLAHAPLAVALADAGGRHRIALGQADEDWRLPYAVYSAQHSVEHSLNGAIADDVCLIELDIWATTAAESSALADLAADALRASGAPCIVTGRSPTVDPELSIRATTLAVTWID